MSVKNKNIEDFYPLSPMQQGILFHSIAAPESGVYFEQLSWTLEGNFNIAAFQQAWQQIVERHSILRTCFVWEGLKEPVQVVHRQVRLPWVLLDLRHLSSVEQQQQLEAFLKSDRSVGFELTRPPLIRLTLHHLAKNYYHFTWSHHHLLIDGWSNATIFKEVFDCYKAFSKDQDVYLEPIRCYRDYIVWLQQQNLSQAEAFWRQLLKGFTTPTRLWVDKGFGQLLSSKDGNNQQEIKLSVEKTAALQFLGQQQQLTLNTLVQGAWALLLSRYSGEEDVVFGATTSGRPSTLAKAESMVGLFINTLPVRVKVSPKEFLLPWLKQIQTQQIETRQYEYSPLLKVQGWSEVPRSLPLFESIVVFENYPVDASLRKLDLNLEIKSFSAFERTNYSLTLSVNPGKELLLQITSDGNERFDTDTINRMLGHLKTLLEGMVANLQQRLSELPLLTEAERHQLLVWNNTQVDYPQNQCIHELFEAQVERTPDSIAVVFEDQQLTYRELNAKANQLAHYLRSLGVEPEVLVGICVERSLEMVIGLLGILKAGGAYVPLDPAYPAERLAFILQDAQVPVLLTQQRLIEKLPESQTRTVCLDTDWGSIAQQSQQNLISNCTTDNLAYIIYTSGSTGQPKGVLVNHANVVRLFVATESWYNFNQKDVFSLFHSYAFDFSVWELWGALLYGGKLVLVPYWLSRSPQDFYKLLSTQQVTVLNQTPSAFRQLIQAEESLGDANKLSLRLVIFGGEALELQSLKPWFERYGDQFPQLVNMYGITETTVHVTYRPLTSADLEAACGNFIGRPIPDLQVYLLDQYQQLVPIGVRGEIYVGGAGVARGYLNRPELTLERFIPNSFSDKPNARLYKSGDQGRYLPNGDIEYLGRIDYQVKVRGFRIELSEIEAHLSQYPKVRETVVVVSSDETYSQRIVAYVVPQSQQTLTITELRDFLELKLANYMMPAAFVMLDVLPLTPNGKVDRKALPAPKVTQLLSESDFIAPSTPIEEMLALIWAEVLGIEKVGIHNNFFTLGGHSLLATRVISQVRQVFQQELPLRRLFEQPTIAGLAKDIEKATKAGLGLEAANIERISRSQNLPLSFAQQRLWFLAQLEPNSPFYNIPAAVRLQGQLNQEALQQSFNEILRRHEGLRTNFHTIEGQPVAVISSATPLPLPLVDISELPSSQQQASVRQLAYFEAQQPFDLNSDFLLRVKLLRLGEQEYIVLLTMHHIASDGWSIGVLVREIAKLYQAFCDEQPSALAELPIQYVDFAAWQRQWLQGKVLQSQISYWLKHLEGAPTLLELPTDHPRPATQTFQGATYSFELSVELSVALKKLSQHEGVTLFMTLLAAFQTLLWRYTGQEDIVVGSPIANRNRADIEGLIGFFVNTLVLRTKMGGNPTFRELLTRVRELALGAYAHQDLPFEQLVEELQPPRDLSYTPLFQVMFVLQNAPMSALELPGLTFSPLASKSSTAKFDLTLDMTERVQGLVGTLEYNTDLFESSTICRMVGHLQMLLSGIVANPQQRLSELPLLTQPEKTLLVEWNDTSVEYPQHQCIHQLFEIQVERSPDAIAIVFEDQQLTYQQLNQRANKLAYYLRSLGVSPEVLVGICVERSLDMVIAILATLKAGGVYVPLDPSYPQERLALILEDAKPLVLLTQKQVVAQLPKHGAKVVCMDADWEINDFSYAQENHSSSVTAKNLAYVIYTSGSTGTPKGVLITHQALVNHSIAAAKAYELQPEDRILQFASISFDVAAEELFPSWLSGSTVVIRPNRVLAFAHFLQFLKQEKLTVLNLPTAYWHEWVSNLAQTEAPLPVTLRLVIVGTEQTLPEKLALWEKLVGDGQSSAGSDLYEKIPGGHLRIRWLNAYGPTEATIGVTIYEPASCQESQSVYSVPIGRPIANTQVYLLDKHLNPTPFGVPGELYIGGVGIARGYLNRPKLTAEKFIPNPFSEKSGTHLYKTGDLARYLSDGNIELLGRIDDQVKIRGFRIEPGEVESKLSQHAKVREALVVAWEDEQSDKHLVAYVSAHPEQTLTATELRGFLQEKLPQYMVPSAFIVLSALPLLPNGKLDRRSLPAPETLRPELEVAYVMPQTEIEQAIATVWQISLNVEKIGIHDNFFELGGHSLLMVRVHTQLHEIFKIDLSLLDLFRYPTISSLAEFLNQAKNKTSSLNETHIQIEKISAGKSQQQKRLNKMKSMNNKGVKEE
ncbi:MAG: amino acid adenylation domain-containing protein [Nostoc sp.]|uniref:amino acid adenylation domain-containing protein n=1 Tax=Nostoc sp. TaxID=1180 RepID=UPI002FFCAC32